MFPPLGDRGGGMVRCAVWDKMILLLFGEEVFLGFGWLLLILGGCAQASHTPCPSREGRFWMLGSCW